MNILLLGNGFDLNHMFPTSYINFLNTVVFLIDADREKISTIKHIFGDEELQKKDSFIQKCYEKHKRIYAGISLEKDLLEKMVEKAKQNSWFNYLSGSVAKNMTWIDFEKEIVRVLKAFNNFFESDIFRLTNKQVIFDFAKLKSGEDKYIIKCFSYFFEEKNVNIGINVEMMQIKDEYVIEKIVGSGTYHLCQDKIISTLYMSLLELADILKMYLKLFVDVPSKAYSNLDITPRFESIPSAKHIYSFNYTNTYEILYNSNNVEHIHGNTDTDIILGVNPDETDELYNIDTAFLQFKKYFQRTFYATDNSFLEKIFVQQRAQTLEETKLYVVGHSLDSTDKDVIKMVFEIANKICILYYNDTSVKDQIKNLVEIYGKQGLDRLRIEKSLSFIKQSDVVWEFHQND